MSCASAQGIRLETLTAELRFPVSRILNSCPFAAMRQRNFCQRNENTRHSVVPWSSGPLSHSSVVADGRLETEDGEVDGLMADGDVVIWRIAKLSRTT